MRLNDDQLPHLGRRRVAASFALAPPLAGVRAHARSKADNRPGRPIRILIGFPPGGSTDAPVRVLAETGSRILKQPAAVENRPGAGGTMPAIALQAASSDGCTLGISSLGINIGQALARYEMEPAYMSPSSFEPIAACPSTRLRRSPIVVGRRRWCCGYLLGTLEQATATTIEMASYRTCSRLAIALPISVQDLRVL